MNAPRSISVFLLLLVSVLGRGQVARGSPSYGPWYPHATLQPVASRVGDSLCDCLPGGWVPLNGNILCGINSRRIICATSLGGNGPYSCLGCIGDTVPADGLCAANGMEPWTANPPECGSGMYPVYVTMEGVECVACVADTCWAEPVAVDSGSWGRIKATYR